MAIKDILRLSAIGQQESRLIIGLMSGTSLDGLDIALCRLSGSGSGTKAEVLQFTTVSYQDDFRDDIRTIFSKKEVDLEKLCLLNELIAIKHAAMITESLQRWNISPDAIDCIASHGQSVYHAPRRLHGYANYPNATLQIGDGDHIAVKTGIITLSDFRQKNVAAGGEGAPLAGYGDQLLFSSVQENRILLNIGGIANFTYLPASADALMCTDTGPGNTLIDAVAQKYFNRAYDANGELAASGTVNEELLDELLKQPFFGEAIPKTTGPELFNLQLLDQCLAKLNLAAIAPLELIATVTRLTAVTVANAIKSLDISAPVLYVSGGGCHNPSITNEIIKQLPLATIKPFTALGIDPDAKEAVLFAVLANETLAGTGTHTVSSPAITMGKISLPN